MENPMEEQHNEPTELDLQTLKADFAVAIEEILGEECSNYECVLCDEKEIGVLWHFVVDDSIIGFLGVEDNEEGVGVPTVAVGINIRDITDYDRDGLMHILELNSLLINATFSVTHFPVKTETEQEPVFIEEGESVEFNDEEEDENTEMHDMLMIQCKIPLSVFEPQDFNSVIQNLMIQADMALNADEEDENEGDE